MPGSATRHRRSRHERTPFQHPLHAAQVLGRAVDLSALSQKDHDLGARLPLQVNVGGGSDVLPPTMLGRGESPENVRGFVTVQQGDDPQSICVGVSQRTVGELRADECPDRVRATRTVPLLDPMIEEG